MRNVAPKFKSTGGWFLAIVSLPPSHYGYPPTLEGYCKAFEIVISEARIAKEMGLRTATFIGLHPADVEKNISRIGIDKALHLIDEVLKVIERYLRNGLVNGLGEFGRPHYRASPEAFSINEYLTIRALEIARDYNVPIHLHLEQKGEATIASISKLVELINVPKKLVLIHHADTKTSLASSRCGFYFTALGRFELVKNVLERIQRIDLMLIESDHIDDPKRPGVALYPWQIRDCVDKLLSSGLSEELLYKVLVDNVTKFFDVEPP